MEEVVGERGVGKKKGKVESKIEVKRKRMAVGTYENTFME